MVGRSLHFAISPGGLPHSPQLIYTFSGGCVEQGYGKEGEHALSAHPEAKSNSRYPMHSPAVVRRGWKGVLIQQKTTGMGETWEECCGYM